MSINFNRLKKGQIVAVVWNDTNIPEKQGWMTESEHQEWIASCGAKVMSVGIYISQDKNFIKTFNIAKGFIESLKILK